MENCHSSQNGRKRAKEGEVKARSGRVLGGYNIWVKFWIMRRNLPAKGLGERSDILHKKSTRQFQRSLNTSAWLDGKTSWVRKVESADFGRCQITSWRGFVLEFEFYPGGTGEPRRGFKQWSHSSLAFQRFEFLIHLSSSGISKGSEAKPARGQED